MRIAFLTTDTLHHCYFLEQLQEGAHDIHLFVETTGVKPPFEISHDFEAVRETYEAEHWFKGEARKLSHIQEGQYFENINQATDAIAAIEPDLVLIFGTRRLSPEMINICGEAHTWNLHGGDPELYRGLDSHLWAIYHKDFSSLVTCLHYTNPALDDGAVIGRKSLPLFKDMKLHQLRKVNTEICVDLVTDALSAYEIQGQVSIKPQKQIGRYYSFMPNVMKSLCVKYFEAHTARL